eukprot:gene16608-22850_t
MQTSSALSLNCRQCRCTAVRLPRTTVPKLQAKRNCAVQALNRNEGRSFMSTEAPMKAVAAGVIAAFLIACPPSKAELEMVPASQVMQAAAPLPKPEQPVGKTKIWGILGLGSFLLFGSVLVLENNENFFPAISKANKALGMQKKQESAEDKAISAELQLELAYQKEQQEARRQARLVEAELAQRRAAALAAKEKSRSMPETLERPDMPSSAPAIPVEVATATPATTTPATPAEMASEGTAAEVSDSLTRMASMVDSRLASAKQPAASTGISEKSVASSEGASSGSKE